MAPMASRKRKLAQDGASDSATAMDTSVVPIPNKHKRTAEPSQKNRHPDKPRRPLTAYMLFYLDKKDKVCKENPGMDETQVTKHISLRYRNCPENEKQMYREKAARKKQEYKGKMEQFYEDHPDLHPKVQSQDRHPDLPRRPLRKYKLFFLDAKDKVCKENPGMDIPQVSKHIAQMYKNLSEKEKQMYQEKVAKMRHEYKEKMRQFHEDHPDLKPKAQKATVGKAKPQIRRPDKPTRPVSTYKLFYRDNKDKVSKDNPGMNQRQVSQHIYLMYEKLSAEKKQMYTEKAARMRQEYEEKMKQYNKDHPRLKRKVQEPNIGKAKPQTPFMLFYNSRLEKCKNDTDFNRASLSAACQEEWKNLSEKMKMKWINQTCKQEQRYYQSLKKYRRDHPELKIPLTSVLSKKERQLRDRFAGKPERPPQSGHFLYSSVMMPSAELKNISGFDRLQEISRRWWKLEDDERKKYNDQAKEMMDKYELEYASYLESLSQVQRQMELESNPPRKRKRKAAPINPKKVKKESDATDEDEQPRPEVRPSTQVIKSDSRKGRKLYKNEPEPPPTTAYALFLQTFVTEANATAPTDRKEDAPRHWQELPEIEKSKYRKQLSDMKQKYIKQHEKFIKSLSLEERAEYTVIKGSRQQAAGKDNDKGTDSDSDESDNE